MSRNSIVLIGVILIASVVLIYFFYEPNGKTEKKEIVPASWVSHYNYDSRDPYGTYMFYELLKSSVFSFKKHEGDAANVIRNRRNENEHSLLVVCARQYPDYVYLWNEIGEFVERGNSALFILEEDPSSLKEHYLGALKTNSYLDSSTTLNFNETPDEHYSFDKQNNFIRELTNWNYFEFEDSVFYEADSFSEIPGTYFVYTEEFEFEFIVHETNDQGKAVYIEIPYGEGSVFIHRVPVAFSNMALIEEKNVEHAEKVLSVIDYDNIIYNVPARPGAPKATGKPKISPLQFILSDPALSWAYYITLGGLLLFFLFNLKRRQRPIPLYPSRTNSTIEFAEALSKIYFQKHNNQNLVKHKYRIFTTFIRTHYHLNHLKNETEYARLISVKSGIGLKTVESLLIMFDRYTKANSVNDDQLIGLHQALDNFYKHCK